MLYSEPCLTRKYTASQKTGPLFTAYNFRNIEQIFTKFGTNHVLLIHAEHHAIIYLNQPWKIVAPSGD